MPIAALAGDLHSIFYTYREESCTFPSNADGFPMRSLLNAYAAPDRPPAFFPPPSQPRNHSVTTFSDQVVPESFFTHSNAFRDTLLDLVALLFVAGLLLLSCLAFAFILHFKLRSNRSRHLQNFNSLWTVRSLLVLFTSLWAVNELVRLPFVRINSLFPFLPSLTLDQQADICKLHIVLSLGFFEPSFLIILFYLLNVSIKETNPRRRWSLVSLLIFGSPMIGLEIVVVYFSPWESKMPEFMHLSSVVSSDGFGNKTVLCTYPFFSWLIFGGFAAIYGLGFLFSCWRVMAFVINKGIGHRVYCLATAVMVMLPVQILCLCLSEMWSPVDVQFGCVILVMCICVACCMAVAEVLLVLKPLRDALAVGGDCSAAGDTVAEDVSLGTGP